MKKRKMTIPPHLAFGDIRELVASSNQVRIDAAPEYSNKFKII